VKHVGDGGQRLHDDAAGRKRRLDLPQRDPRLAQHKGPQVVRVLLQQGTPVAPNLRRCRAAGLAHPLHQLDGRRSAHREAAGRLPDRAPICDGRTIRSRRSWDKGAVMINSTARTPRTWESDHLIPCKTKPL
jgi:hypothetical protein